MLVIYFSRAGENYNVGVVSEGSTAKLAHMIAQQADAGLIEIVPERMYPRSYEDAKAVIQRELDTQARPAVTLRAVSPADLNPEQAIAQETTIALGYPIWCGHVPMPVRTFLDSHSFSGKTILPFCTNEGSGLGCSIDDLRAVLPNAIIAGGFPVRGSLIQHDPEAAGALVRDWWNSQSAV